jgi:hypothetical protein
MSFGGLSRLVRGALAKSEHCGEPMKEKRPSITTGDVKGANVLIGSKQTVHGDLSIHIVRIPNAPMDLQQRLANEIAELVDALRTVPGTHADKAQEVRVAAEDAVREVSQPQRDKTRIEIRKGGLIKAAEALKAITPAVLTVAYKVASTIAGIS